MEDVYTSVIEKVRKIFQDAFPDRADRVDGRVVSERARSLFSDAFADEYPENKAFDIGFHLADWNGDAAFITAVHLFPERFTKEEVAAGVQMFLTHAPAHIVEAARLLDVELTNPFSNGEDAGQ